MEQEMSGVQVEETFEEIGQYVKYMRDYMKMSEDEFAYLLGLPIVVLKDLEKGQELWLDYELLIEEIKSSIKKFIKFQESEWFCGNDYKGKVIEELNEQGLNTVQIGLRVGIDEIYIEIFLIEQGKVPSYFTDLEDCICIGDGEEILEVIV